MKEERSGSERRMKKKLRKKEKKNERREWEGRQPRKGRKGG